MDDGNEDVAEFISEWPPLKKKCVRPADDSLSHKAPSGASTTHEPAGAHLFGEKKALSPEEIFLAECDSTLLVNPFLAKWWKLSGRTSVGSDESAEIAKRSSNPNTLLHSISRLPEAQRVLQHRYHFLRREATKHSNPKVCIALASCCQKLGHSKEGTTYCYLALRVMLKDRDDCCLKDRGAWPPSKTEPADEAREEVMEVLSKGVVGAWSSEVKEAQWLLHVLLRQADMEEKAQILQGCVPRGVTPVMPTPIAVERRCHVELHKEEFLAKYACGHTPVIITGLVDHLTSVPWTLDHIKKTIGEKLAPLKRMVPSSMEWAKLEPAGVCKVQGFIESLDTVSDANMGYLFDWSLPLHCPDLMKELTLPVYFADNMLQQTPPGMLYRDSWPSLFIAPKGLCSELHVDAFGSNFWMALFEGKKRWILFPPEDTPCLYPLYTHTTDASFQVNLAVPDLSHHPLLAMTHPWECVLQPGELLFVPSGCPHRVENMEKSLAISANFVDSSNMAKVLDELKINALVDDRSQDLLEALQRISASRSR